MTTVTARQWLLKEKPGDDIDVYETFEVRETQLTAEPDKLLVRTEYISNDPAQRTWMSKHIQPDRHYMKMIEVGEVMKAGAVVKVIDPGNNTDYQKGDLLSTFTGWTEYALISPDQVVAKVKIPPEDFLALGSTGLTAAVGLYKIGTPKESDKLVVVSGAAGATGSIVCQIAKKVLNKTVVGIAGSDEKCKLLKELGCDIALNYKSETYEEEFEKATEGYIDIYWDNVGGRTLDMAVGRMAKNGRVISCGAISGYNNIKSTTTPAISMESYMKMIPLRVRIESFIFFDYKDELEDFKNNLGTWWIQGKVKPLKTVWETPFEKVPDGMIKLLKGENTGKLVTKIEWPVDEHRSV